MPKKNKGPCAINNCESASDTDNFRIITDIALKKLEKYPDYEEVDYLKLNDQLCFPHYMKYIESMKRRRLEAKDYNKDNNEMEDINYNLSLKNIKIDITEDGVLLSKEDFKLLVEKVNDMQLTIEDNQKQIESLIETVDIHLRVQNDLRKSKLKSFIHLLIIFNTMHNNNNKYLL